MTKITYSLLSTNSFMLDGGAMFGIIPKPLWQKAIECDELNRICMDLRVLAIKQENRHILIDVGIGDYHESSFQERFGMTKNPSGLVEALKKKCQLGPEEITDVIVSHLHFDHCGGLLSQKTGELLLTFPNATLHLHRKHFDYSFKATPRDYGSFQNSYYEKAIDFYQKKNQIHWLEGDEGIILDFKENPLLFKTSHGHTPFHIHPYNQDFLFLGDLLPTTHHLNPAWVMGYDISPGISSVEKSTFLNFIYKHNLIAIFDHDEKKWGASLSKNSKGFEWISYENEMDLPQAYFK